MPSAEAEAEAVVKALAPATPVEAVAQEDSLLRHQSRLLLEHQLP